MPPAAGSGASVAHHAALLDLLIVQQLPTAGRPVGWALSRHLRFPEHFRHLVQSSFRKHTLGRHRRTPFPPLLYPTHASGG
jgi:hypothetical protein